MTTNQGITVSTYLASDWTTSDLAAPQSLYGLSYWTGKGPAPSKKGGWSCAPLDFVHTFQPEFFAMSALQHATGFEIDADSTSGLLHMNVSTTVPYLEYVTCTLLAHSLLVF